MARPVEIEIFKAFCAKTGAANYRDFRDDCDAPDFPARDGTVAVELVSYCRDASRSPGDGGSPRRHWEDRLERLVADTRKRYLRLKGVGPDVYVFQVRQVQQVPLDVPPEAGEELMELVAKRAAGSAGAIPASLRTIVEEVRVSQTPPYEREAQWWIALADRTDVDVSSIQTILQAKESHVREYRKHAKELWLLIHGSRMPYVGADPGEGRWSTCGHVTAQLAGARFQSSFDRVYYFDQDQSKHLQLSVEGGLTKPLI